MEIKSPVQQALKEYQEQLTYNSLQVGDIVQYLQTDQNYPSYLGIIVKKENHPFVWALMLGINDTKYEKYWWFKVMSTSLIKIRFFEGDVIEELRNGINLYYPTHSMYGLDNLTYVEILAKLKEYESRI